MDQVQIPKKVSMVLDWLFVFHDYEYGGQPVFRQQHVRGYAHGYER